MYRWIKLESIMDKIKGEEMKLDKYHKLRRLKRRKGYDF